MRRSAKIRAVLFFGSDGTGKTTQARLLLAELRGRGIKSRKVWIRGRHTFSFAISMIMLKLGYGGFLLHAGAPGGKILDPRRIPGKKFWAFVEFASVVPLILVRFYIPRLLGYYIVAERYVVDSIVYNRFFLGSDFDPYAKVLLHMIPVDALSVHLDATRAEVLSRRADDTFSVSFVDYQLREYRRLAAALSALRIDTTKTSIEETSRLILERCSLAQTKAPSIELKV
jgi:thymidylate kinase